MLYGSGSHTYELSDWEPEFPEDRIPTEVNALCIDDEQRLYVFSNMVEPVMVFDRDGRFIESWGAGSFTHPHGCCMDHEGALYCADDANHTVGKYDRHGQELMLLGNRDRPSDTGFTSVSETGEELEMMEALTSIKRVGPPFNAPTCVAVAQNGDIFAGDGYGNARIHRFSKEGELILSWGEPGRDTGQFIVPHGIAIDKEGRVFVADRHNNRIQVFDAVGEHITTWTDVVLPTCITIDDDQTVYVSELIPPRISIFDIEGRLLARWGNEGSSPDAPLFGTLHSIAVDPDGDVFVTEVLSFARQPGPFYMEHLPKGMIHRFSRIG